MKFALTVVGLLCLTVIVGLGWFRTAASEPQRAPETALQAAPSQPEPGPKINSTKLNSAKQDSAKQDSAKQDSAKQDSSNGESSVLIVDFAAASEAAQWRAVDDNVMGGISQGRLSLTPDGTGLFRGTLSLENNGGFSSVRRGINGADFAAAEAIELRVKGDGRPYQLRLKMNRSSRAPSYRADFETPAGEWRTVSLPLSDFEPVFRGRRVPDAPALVPAEIQEIGLLLADKQNGEFELEIAWIKAD